MITNRLVLDLSAARSGAIVKIGSAASVRFHVVPALVLVGVNNGPMFEVQDPFTYAPCTERITHLVLTHDAAPGAQLVILVADSREEFTHFLGGSRAGGTEVLYAHSVPGFPNVSAIETAIIASSVIPNLASPFGEASPSFFNASIGAGDSLTNHYNDAAALRTYAWRHLIPAATAGNRRVSIVASVNKGMPLASVLLLPQASAHRASFGRYFLECDFLLGNLVNAAATTRKMYAGLNLAGIPNSATVNALTGLFYVPGTGAGLGADFRLCSLIGINADVNQPYTALFDHSTGIVPSTTVHQRLRLELHAQGLDAYINGALVAQQLGPIPAATLNALASNIVRANLLPMNGVMGTMVCKDASAVNADTIEAFFGGGGNGLRFGWIPE